MGCKSERFNDGREKKYMEDVRRDNGTYKAYDKECRWKELMAAHPRGESNW